MERIRLIVDKKANGKILINSFIKEKQIDMTGVTCIKMDVEGYEGKVIKGAKESICNAEKLLMAVCIYHKQCDAEEILSLVNRIGGGGFDRMLRRIYVVVNRYNN